MVENILNFYFSSFNIYPRLPNSMPCFQSYDVNCPLQMEKFAFWQLLPIKTEEYRGECGNSTMTGSAAVCCSWTAADPASSPFPLPGLWGAPLAPSRSITSSRHRQGRQMPRTADCLERKFPTAQLFILPFHNSCSWKAQTAATNRWVEGNHSGERDYHCPYLSHSSGRKNFLELCPSSLSSSFFPACPFEGWDNLGLFLGQQNLNLLELLRSLQLALDSPPLCLCFLKDLLSFFFFFCSWDENLVSL